MCAARGLPDIARTEDYLAWVTAQPYIYETILGRIYLMSGNEDAHSRITANAASVLDILLLGDSLEAHDSDFLVEIDADNRYFPDVAVARGERRSYTDQPAMVVEVLSPSTMREDFGPKLSNYLRIAGLCYVLYLWPDEPLARLWEPGSEPRDMAGLEAVIALPELGIDLRMAELYRDVRFDS